MRRFTIFAGPLVPLLVWSLLWWSLGKPEMILAGAIFFGIMLLVWFMRAKLDGPEWSTVRALGTALGTVVGLCTAVLAMSWLMPNRVGDPLSGDLDPLTYGRFEVVGRIISWDVLPVSSPEEYEEWEPLLMTVAGDGGTFEFVCDGREIRARLEHGRLMRATGEVDDRHSINSTPVADEVELLD